jgi:hypothetical protein
MRPLLTVLVTIGLVLVAAYLLRQPMMQSFLADLWRQIHLTRQ